MNRKIIFYAFLLLQLTVSCKSSTHSGRNDIQQDSPVGANSFLDFFNKEPENKELTPAEYVQWVRDERNGLRVNRQEGAYTYEIQYQPVEYLVVLQERSEVIAASTLKEEAERRGDLLYFTFKMSSEKGKGILSDNDLVIENKDIYLLSGLQQDIMLAEGQDTLECVMLHFESSNNLVPYDQCVLAFEKPGNPASDFTFLFRTEKYAGGWVKIPIKRESINRIPKLKTN
ncbi:MAG: hypothetical protein LBR52_03450 [Prevotellaceae bacterium]|jgi:hypothetical protein|nr:hypothetical protein [Prevotellaceae bacterium]